MTPPPALPCTIFLLLMLGLAGVVHVLWLRSSWSQRFAYPLDAGLCLRQRRLFGDNKTLRGLLVMPFATALIFTVFTLGRQYLPIWLNNGMWKLSTLPMAGIGFLCGLAFMLAELPNSLFKRQLDIAPGAAASSPRLRVVCFLLDRCDSTLGVLFALTLLVPLEPLVWLWTLLLGSGLHALFSVALYRLKLKKRAL